MTEPQKRIPLSDIAEVWFEAPNTILDAVHPVTGKPVWGSTDYTGQPGVERMSFDEALERQANHWRSPPSEITWKEFDDALNVLPPVAWCNWSAAESFKISERTSGNITAIYCRIGDTAPRYFHLSDSIFLKHDEIVRRCREALAGGRPV